MFPSVAVALVAFGAGDVGNAPGCSVCSEEMKALRHPPVRCHCPGSGGRSWAAPVRSKIPLELSETEAQARITEHSSRTGGACPYPCRGSLLVKRSLAGKGWDRALFPEVCAVSTRKSSPGGTHSGEGGMSCGTLGSASNPALPPQLMLFWAKILSLLFCLQSFFHPDGTGERICSCA